MKVPPTRRMNPMHRSIPLVLIACLWVARSLVAGPAEDRFEREIRPIFVEHCQKCHGQSKQMAGLRLDSRKAALAGGGNGPVLLPGKPADSRLVQMLKPAAEKRMPPKVPLTDKQIGLIEDWVRAGAAWPESASATRGPAKREDLWSFKPLASPATKSGIPSAIDGFISDRLQKEGMHFAPPASRRALLRRASYVLTGLPPTLEQVEAFEKNTAPNAWEKEIDRLLASPALGERWARHWMDVARYSDTKGYVFFQDGSFPWAYAYRDWLIQSFNSDLPYDRFVRSQIAADRLVAKNEAQISDLPALGFLSLGGRFMNNQHDIIDDRIDVVTRGLLGLTVACSRCHDHKFDPVPTVDYYSLYSIFAASVEPEVPPLFAKPPATPEQAAFQKEMTDRENRLGELITKRHQETLEAARTRLADHLMAVREQRGKPAQDEFMLIADPKDPNPTLLKRWRAWLDAPARKTNPIWKVWLAIEALGDKDFAPELQRLLDQPESQPAPKSILENLRISKADTPTKAAEAFAKAFTEESRKKSPELAALWVDSDAPWSTPQSAFTDLELFPDRAGQGVLQDLRKKVEAWRIDGKGAPPRAHGLVDAAKPETAHIFLRGNPFRPGDLAPRLVPDSLGRKQTVPSGSGRLELAQAITSPDHPLLARVWVNRVWAHTFGEGLVRTPGDFGSRGESPTHPELLDHLAGSFIREGWSLKKLLKQMLTSQTWMQGQATGPSTYNKDPENFLVSRMEPRRLEFESLRDSLLLVSGRLDAKISGPSVGDINAPRRTLYLRLDRLQVPQLYRAFDFPSPDTSSVKRDQTTTPLQALWLMNSPFALECARQLAQRSGDSKKTDEWIEKLYRHALQQKPTTQEIQTLKSFLTQAGPDGPVQAAQALLAGNSFAWVD